MDLEAQKVALQDERRRIADEVDQIERTMEKAVARAGSNRKKAARAEWVAGKAMRKLFREFWKIEAAIIKIDNQLPRSSRRR